MNKISYNLPLMVTGKPHKPTRFTRFVLYPMVGLVFICVLTVILIMANGYRFTLNDAKIGMVKTGMLIVTSRPFDAQIVLNSKISKYRSGFYFLPTKISALAPGFYDIEVKKSGYRTWRNRLEITPNSVTWANYILLFADKLNISDIETPSGAVVGASPNGRHMLYADTEALSFSLKSQDTSSLAVKDFWPQVLPVDPWLIKPQILSAHYSSSSDKVLLAIKNGEKTEYVVVDASGSQPKLVKVSEVMSKNLTDARWSLTNNNELYIQVGSELYIANFADTLLGNPIASGVVSWNISDTRQIFYVVKNVDTTHSLDKMALDGGQKEKVASSVVPSKAYEISYAPQSSMVAVRNLDTNELDAYSVGGSVKKYSLKMAEGVLGFGWAKGGQKLDYWGSGFVKRYDWEKNKETQIVLTESPKALVWYFDDSHYLIDSDRGLYIVDFDGANKVFISSSPVFNTILDVGNSNIIFGTKADDGQVTYQKYIAEF